MKEISQNALVILITVFVVVSVISTLTMQAVTKVPQAQPSSTSGTVNIYVLPKPSSSEGQVSVVVLPKGGE